MKTSMKAVMFLLFVMSLTAKAQPESFFQSGDTFACTDAVSGTLSTLKVLDMGDEDAYVRIKSSSGVRFYNSKMVRLRDTDEGLVFSMFKGNDFVQAIVVHPDVLSQKIGTGTYEDRRDSRPLACRRVK